MNQNIQRERSSLFNFTSCHFPIVLAIAFLATWETAHADPFQIVDSPTLLESDNGLLTRVLEFSTDIPTKGSFLVSGGGESWRVESHTLQTQHRLPVLGMTFGTDYTVSQLKLQDGDGTQASLGNQFNFTTVASPTSIGNLTVLESQPALMEPGITLFAKGPQTIGVDASGVIRWYYSGPVRDIHRTTNGNFLGNVRKTIREFDLTGRTARDWTASGNPAQPSEVTSNVAVVSANNFHHDAWLIEGTGNILSIEDRHKTVLNYPTSTSDPNAPLADVLLNYDAILEFDTAGNVVQEWDLSQILDQNRLSYNIFAASSPGRANWSHTNAVYHDPTDDTIVVSMRTQDLIAKFERSTGDLKWILGNHENWGTEFQQYLLTPISGPGETFEWPYHQHNPSRLENGRILLYDNGNHRASPFDGTEPLPNSESYSRTVEYAIDEENMTVTQVWSWGKEADEVIFTGATGGVDSLPLTNNSLSAAGNIAAINGSIPSPRVGRIQEVTQGGQIVWDLEISGSGPVGVYRSERLELYDPLLFTVTTVPSPTSAALSIAALLHLALSRRRVVNRS